MDLTPQAVHAAPGAPLTQTDINLVGDAGILTNVQAPSLTRVLNPVAASLDFPAGTGAAFDKRDSVYNIYQRWPEKSTTINGAITAGSELFRISLNPMTLPARLLDWVAFHQSCIPAIDVAIAIGGAAGTISWLAFGWIPDDSATATLDSIQQVSCEHVNMNNTMIVRFNLNDNRRTGLFRRIPVDEEQWPAIVCLVNHPAINVQRNDDVNYPIDVYVRFAPNAIFMEPYNVLNTGGELSTSIDLSYYLTLDQVDILIGTQNVCNAETDLIDLPDSGWNTGLFAPVFNEQNLLTMRRSFNGAVQNACLSTMGEFPTKEDMDAAKSRINPNGPAYSPPISLMFGFGSVPGRIKDAPWPQPDGAPLGGIQGTTYAIQEYEVIFGMVHYKSISMTVYEFGCIITFNADYKVIGNWMVLAALPEDQDNNPGSSLPFYHADGVDQWILCQQKAGDKDLTLRAGQGLKDLNNAYPPKIRLRKIGEPANKFYTFTYTQTGNAAPSSSLPAGLVTLNIIRPGTTTTLQDQTAFWPIMAPDLRGAKKILEDWRARLKTMWLAFEAEINGVGIGTVVYAEGVMACRTSTPRQIRTGLPTRIVARNIRAIASPAGIPNLNVEGFNNWWSNPTALKLELPTAVQTQKPRFANIPMQREAAGFALGAASGLTNGLMDWFTTWQRNEWQKDYQKRNIDALLSLKRMETIGQQELADQQFKNRLSLLGYTGPSANNAQRIVQEQSTNTDARSNSDSGTTTEPFAEADIAQPLTTDIRGIDGINAFENNPTDKQRPAWMRGAQATPFKQVENLNAGRPANALPGDAPAPPSTIDAEETLPGYAAFDPTSIGLPHEPLEEFVRGEPKRSAFRLPRSEAVDDLTQLELPNPERLLQPDVPGPSGFQRTDVSRQPFRAKASRATQNSGPAPQGTDPAELPYDFLRFDPLRMGKRDFTGSQFGPQHFIRSDPARQGQRSFPTSAFGPQQFNRNDPLRQATRTPTRQFPPQQFVRDDPMRTARRDFAGIPFASSSLTSQPAGQLNLPTTERLI